MNLFDDIKLHYKMGGFEQKLIYWNVCVFLLSVALFYKFKVGFFDYPDWLYLSSYWNIALYKPWTLLTYSFLHSDIWHLFFNMMVLNFAGRLFLTFFTQKQLLGVYLLSAIFAALTFVAVYYAMGMQGEMIGASGAVMAILIAAATYAPTMQLRFLLIGSVKLWHVAGVLLLLDLLYILADNTGGHIAHLSGAFFGFVYVKLLQNGTDLTKGVTSILNFFANLFSRNKKAPLKTVHRNYDRKPEKTASKIVTKDKTQQQIDEILDKISQSGYDSLTKEEKEFLFKAGK